MQRTWIFHILLVEMRNGITIRRNSLSVSYKTKHFTIKSIMPGIYPSEIKIYVHKKSVHKYS